MVSRRAPSSRRRACRAVVPVAALCLLTACTSKNAGNRCNSDAECTPSEQCAGGLCVSGPIACSATQSCPAGQSCCGGLCSPTQCCLADLECANGYCHDGACRDGPRPRCSEIAVCPGRCLQTIDACVECIY